jgi:predicted GNAT family acetyltransferase
MEPLNITNNQQNQQFQVFVGDDRAFLEYRIKDGLIMLMHTEVPDNLSGKGIASSLAAYAFSYARTHHLGVKAYCPFVVTWLKKHPEQADLLAPSTPRGED